MSANAKSEEITKTDLTNPKKVGIKILHALVSGSGGILQEGISSGLTKMVPNPKWGMLVDGAQWLGAGLLNGYIDNDYVESALKGISAGAAKDLTKKLVAFFGINGGMLSGSKTVESKAKILAANVYQTKNEDFF